MEDRVGMRAGREEDGLPPSRMFPARVAGKGRSAGGTSLLSGQPLRLPLNRPLGQSLCLVLCLGLCLGLILFLACPALAQGPRAFRLASPLRCNPPDSCYVWNYVDHDQGQGARDFLGGGLTYNGHNGTDFRVPLAAMKAGIPVLAAAPGRVVLAVSDQPDAAPEVAFRRDRVSDWREEDQPNQVVLDHGGGWVTQYAHLRRGSVRVRPGQDVAAGQVLGLIGLSGRTSFPHVHLEVHWNGRPVDPFVGLNGNGQAQPRGALWTPEASALWPTGGVREISSGFSSARPDLKAVLTELARPPQAWPRGEALVYWVNLLAPFPEDVVEISLFDPRGELLQATDDTYTRAATTASHYVGRLRGTLPAWPPGVYTGKWVLRRKAPEGGVREFSGQSTFKMPAASP